jgi:hypothetical protein
MRINLCLLLLLISGVLYSQEKSDSSTKKLQASGSLSINSNGISSIPAFSLDAPAIIATASLGNGRFSWDPVLAYGLDIRPWFIDNWIHYLIVDKQKFKLRTGINFSMYFSELKLPDKDVLQGERYWALELAGFYYFSPVSNLSLMYWNDRGQDEGTITGHFISLAWDRSQIKAGKSLLFSTYIQLFYIDYDGNNDGLFIAPKISASLDRIPVNIFFQATQAIVSNIEPFPGFKWNVGAGWNF